MQSPIEIIINAGSGVNNNCREISRQITELFSAYNLDARISIAEKGADILELAKKAVESNRQIIVAGGGDGTISAVASKLVGTDKTLGVLPLGTLNHFSKDLNIPQNLAEAVRVIAANQIKKIDVGEVNGRFFVNNSSIGLYPHLVHHREKQERLGKSKWTAAFWAALKILKQSPFLTAKLKIENSEILRKMPFIFIGNNKYEMDFFNIGRRAALDGGKLSVYFLQRPGRIGLFLLAFRTLFGRLKQMKDFEAISTEEIIIETRKKRLLVAFDGEVDVMETPLHYKIHPKLLRVIVPE